MAPGGARARGPAASTAIAKAIAKEHGLQQGEVAKSISSLAEIGAKELTSTGKFTFPGLFMLKRVLKLATKACEKKIFGRMRSIKAKPLKIIVKAYPLSGLKKRLR